MQLTPENYEFFHGAEDKANEILAAYRLDVMRKAEEEDAAEK
jgi:hypothetical protein